MKTKTKKDDININKENIIELNEQDNKKMQLSIRQNKKNNNFSSNGRTKNIEYSNYSNGENKDFLNKKTKRITKIYQNILNKQQMNSGISGNNSTDNKENNNIINTEFSNFEI